MRNSDLKCPECKPFGKSKRYHMLDIICDNYSGTGEDVGSCPECGKSWWIHYEPKIASRAKEWDEPTRSEREEIQKAQQKELDMKRLKDLAMELATLTKKYENEKDEVNE